MTHRFKPGDFIICKPAEEERAPSTVDFEVYARVITVDCSCNTLEIVSFLKQGQVFQGRRGLPLDQCEERYYQPMEKQDLERFIGGLFTFTASVKFSLLMKTQRDLVFRIRTSAVKAWLALEEEKPITYAP